MEVGNQICILVTFTSLERALGIHNIRSWVNCRAEFDDVVKRKIPISLLDFQPNSSSP
jgi:hypothetical protein